MDMHYADIAFNLTDKMYLGKYNGKHKHDPDLGRVIETSVNSGVTKILCTGVSLKESRRTIEIIKAYNHKFPNALFCTVGIHPTNSQDFVRATSPDALLDDIRSLIQCNPDTVKAYGEFGLDRARTMFCPFEIQERYFEPQVKLAAHLGLPLFLHNREASDLFYPTLERNPDVLKAGGVVHSFDGNADDAAEVIKMGLDIGINGCSMKTDNSFAAIRSVPEDRIHFETDAPWCQIKPSHTSYPMLKWSHFAKKNKTIKPDKYKPENFDDTKVNLVHGRNEPALVCEVAEVVWRIRNPDCDDFEIFKGFTQKVYERSCDLFRLNN